MATDGLSLYACIRELNKLENGRIDKVQQPNKDILILHVHAPALGRVRLMLCIHAENGRIQLISHGFENPESPPSFCMLLRKYLIGARISEVSQAGMNRIAVFSLYGKNELQDDVQMKLIVELMGKHGNVFLVDADGKILDCMRHFGLSDQAARLCLPNVPYEAPPEAQKLFPFEADADALERCANGRMPGEWLSESVHGISRLCAEQIVSEGTPQSEIVPSVLSVFRALKEGAIEPCVIPGAGVLPFLPKNAIYTAYPSMNDAQDAFYRQRDKQAIITKSRTSLRAVLDRAKKRAEKRMEEFQHAIDDTERMERDRLYGELLTVSQGAASGSRKSVVVQNYYADPPEPIEVPLDPKLSVSENARRYFKRYQKNKAARTYALEQSETLQAEIEYLGGQLLNVASCTTSEELSEIRDELIRLHYIRESAEQKRRPAPLKSVPIRYRTPSGTDVFVGKNNLQNEKLIRTSDPDATWLHAKGVPASHVVLSAASPSREDLLFAATVAAFHSGASASENVPVDYTLIRHVKKPSGARPGFVNYFHQHTLFVTPDREAIEPYRIKEDL